MLTTGKSQVPRWSDLVRKVMGTKGGSIMDVLQLTQPSFELTSPAPELRPLRGEYLVTKHLSGSALAAQFPVCFFWPKGINDFWVITQLVIQSSSSQKVDISVNQVDVEAAFVVAHGLALQDDGRIQQNTRLTAGGAFASTAATIIGQRYRFNVNVNAPLVLPVEFVTVGKASRTNGPNAGTDFALQVCGETAATDIFVTAHGYVHSMEPTETP